METLLTAIAGFITDHWFLTFLILFFNPIRLFTINENKVVDKRTASIESNSKETRKRLRERLSRIAQRTNSVGQSGEEGEKKSEM